MQEKTTVIHGGCYECGEKEQPFLTSVSIKGKGSVGWALCDKCLEKHEKAEDIRQ